MILFKNKMQASPFTWLAPSHTLVEGWFQVKDIAQTCLKQQAYRFISYITWL